MRGKVEDFVAEAPQQADYHMVLYLHVLFRQTPLSL